VENHEAIQRVRSALLACGVADRVRLFEQAARTSPEAADLLGCAVAQIAKSIVFRGRDDRPVLVVASGANRVDEAKAAAYLGHGLGKANAAYVREVSGFVIGGVSPVGWLTEPQVLIDNDLLALGDFWAAAGHPNAMMHLTAQELLKLTGGMAADIARHI
jgi:prolyl-tRNA editing enzyme YbaK/EbsC (Cys-tRNA(Pro) deacylase)